MNNLKNLPQIQKLSSEEKKIFYDMISSIARLTNGDIDLRKLEELYDADYSEIPVTIDKFLEDDRYMGKVYNNGQSIYPYWRNHLHQVFHDNPDYAFEIALTGAIGIGKSSIAAIALMYYLYRVLCLKNPQKFFGLASNSPIVFVCLNLTLDLAWSGLYSMIVEAIRMSPWFMERCDIRGKYDYSVSFPNNIGLICASNVQHVIGKNVIFAIMDEINFSNAAKGSKKSVLDMYRNIRRRVESRFMRNGRVYGYIYLISSKNTEQDFLDQYIQTLRGNKSTIVVDEPIWNIKPASTYIGEKFKVAVGDKTKASRILSEFDDVQVLESQGYQIIEVPIEYRIAFEQDINDALKDIAGISSVSTSKLIPYAGKIEMCINRERKSPFFTEVIHMGLDTDEDIKDYLDDLSILKKDLHKPRFIHVDIGLKGDMLGIGCVHADSQTMVKKFTPEGNIQELVENKYYMDFAIGIKAIPGSEIPLYKVREFILWLSDYIGYKIKCVSYDGFQSADSIQLLKVAGFDTKLTSVDRSADPYLNVRACILDNRIDIYDHSILKWELYDLEYDRQKNKVDHNPVDGHKDISDTIAGSLWNCQQYYAEKHPSQPLQKQRVAKSIESLKKLNEERRKRNQRDDEYDWLFTD